MHVPLLDLKPQSKLLKEEILDAIGELIDSSQFILGPKVAKFEEEISEYIGAKYSIGVSSGTDALLLSLMALGVEQGDIVITTDFSFFATAGVISRLNAIPKFVDINEDTLNLSPSHLQIVLDSLSTIQLKKVKAIIPVHLYGQSSEMDSLVKIADEYNIPLVEDAAQSLGAQTLIGGTKHNVGEIGKLGCFSFFPTKNLGALGDGGIITTNDDKLADKIQLLRNHGAHPKYHHSIIGGNFRLDALQAVILSLKLKKLNSWHQCRNSNASLYKKLLKTKNIEGVVFPGSCKNEELRSHVYNQFTIRVPQRDKLRKFLLDNDIQTEIYYPIPFHKQKCFSSLGYEDGDFPVSEKAAREVISLPIYPEITEQMQSYVVDKIEYFFETSKHAGAK